MFMFAGMNIFHRIFEKFFTGFSEKKKKKSNEVLARLIRALLTQLSPQTHLASENCKYTAFIGHMHIFRKFRKISVEAINYLSNQ